MATLLVECPTIAVDASFPVSGDGTAVLSGKYLLHAESSCIAVNSDFVYVFPLMRTPSCDASMLKDR